MMGIFFVLFTGVSQIQKCLAREKEKEEETTRCIIDWIFGTSPVSDRTGNIRLITCNDPTRFNSSVDRTFVRCRDTIRTRFDSKLITKEGTTSGDGISRAGRGC